MCQVNEWKTLSLQLLFIFFDVKGLAGSCYDKEKVDYNPLRLLSHGYHRVDILQESILRAAILAEHLSEVVSEFLKPQRRI